MDILCGAPVSHSIGPQLRVSTSHQGWGVNRGNEVHLQIQIMQYIDILICTQYDK